MTSRIIEPVAPALRAAATRLLSAAAVRRSAHRMLALALDDALPDWRVDLARLPAMADFVAGVVRDRYPRLNPPVHSRWRHFVFDGHDLWRERAAQHRWSTPAAAGRAAVDLVVMSVLLDAGAGPGWRFHDSVTGRSAVRSEGLALASLRWFENGGLSDDPHDPLRVDASALRRIDAHSVNAAFQATPGNPLLGVEGRAALLNRLGAALEARADVFALADAPRPGGLVDALGARAAAGSLTAGEVLSTLLEALGSLWQNRPTLAGVALGDCWPHPAFAGDAADDGFVPLHKLSQWLAYSLIEPLAGAGVPVGRIEELTGLAEYRNGGLFVDGGVLVPRDAAALARTYPVADPFVVGWRAMTVALLDRIAPLVGSRLGLTAGEFPLASALEGGTWAAGRRLARARRPDGGPPFSIISDGTVF